MLLFKKVESHYNDNTNDHLFGVSEVGWKIHTLIKELYDKGKSQDYIVNHNGYLIIFIYGL